MENEIELEMTEEKNINIYINNKLVHTITSQNRKINADKIYEILNYSKGNTYTVKSRNDNNGDNKVLDFFKKLFQDIINKINEM